MTGRDLQIENWVVNKHPNGKYHFDDKKTPFFLWIDDNGIIKNVGGDHLTWSDKNDLIKKVRKAEQDNNITNWW